MTNPTPIDVLVVGAGPAGTALAIDLARRGLSVRIVDKSQHAFDGSRAKGVQPRTLEVLEDLGTLDTVFAGGGLYPKVALRAGPIAVPWRMYRTKQPTPDVPYPNTWLIPQHRTDRALHARLTELGVDVEFGRELVDLRQDSQLVTARISDDHGAEEISARYLVGADGGSSTVRRQLGIEFTGSTDDADRMYIADATVTGLSRDRWHMWPLPSTRLITACPLPHSEDFQWMVRLGPDEAPPADAAELTARIRSHTRSSRIAVQEIHWTSVFRPNIRLAERYHSGRAILVGDAAHVHPPTGAQGLNTGIQDSYNLGWKLAQVLAGAGPALLDTYQDERQPIAAGVLGLAVEKYAAMGNLDPSSIRRGKDEQQLALSYFGGPLASAGADRTSTLRVGDRAPDAVLRGADGPARLFDALRGEHFTAVAYGAPAAADVARLPWPTAGAPLKPVVIDAPGSGCDLELSDLDGSFKRIYGLVGTTLLLIRPDGYVGHIATRNHLESARTWALSVTPSPASVPTRGAANSA